MKKIFVLGLILTPIILGAIRVEANDSGPNGAKFYEPENEIQCISFLPNLPEVLDRTDSFLFLITLRKLVLS